MRGSRRDKELAAYHLAGTIVALVAMLVMLAALALAWPAPGWLIAVAVLNTMALVFAAFRWRLPVLHSRRHRLRGLGLPHRVLSADRQTALRRRGSVRRGNAAAHDQREERDGVGRPVPRPGRRLRTLGALGRRRHGAIYLGGCGVVAAAGLLLVTVHGVRTGGADALRAAILYAVYGAGSLALTARWRRLGTELPGPGPGHVGRVVGVVVAVGRAPRRTALGRGAGDRSARHGCGGRSPATLRGRHVVRSLENARR